MAGMYNVDKSSDQIDDLLNRCVDAKEEGVSKYPGMTYEEGVEAGILWVTGQTNDDPLD